MRLRSVILPIGCAAADRLCSRGRARSAFSRSTSAMKCSNCSRGAVSTPANLTACSARGPGSPFAIFRLRSAKFPMDLLRGGCLTGCGSREAAATFFGQAARFRLVLRASFFGRSGLEYLRSMLFWQRIMTLNGMMAPAKRGTLVALAAAAAVLALAEPAPAQYWGGDRSYGGGGGYGGYRSYRQSPQ